jgi:hypothetical protein
MDTEDLRLAVYRAFAGTGRAPSASSLAHELAVTLADIEHGLTELHNARHLVLSEQGEIIPAVTSASSAISSALPAGLPRAVPGPVT